MFAATRMISTWSVLLCVSLMVATTSATWADTINVPRDYETIQEAIDAASDGDEIIVAPGTYNETLEVVAKSITLRSAEGSDVTIIDGQRQGSVITISGTSFQQVIETTIEGFTITGGVGAPHGGGLNQTGLMNSASLILLENCKFVGNAAVGWGGAISASRNVSIMNSAFVDNTASNAGALSLVNFAITSSTFVNNSATNDGGAIGTLEGWPPPVIEDSAFIGNTAGSRGGALHAIGWSEITIQDSLFENNSATHGGALSARAWDYIWAEPATITCTGCVFKQNVASSGGGAFANACMEAGHNATCGKGIFIDCEFIGNLAGQDGGAILNHCITWFNDDLNDGRGGWETVCNLPSVSGSVFCKNAPQHFWGGWIDDGGNLFPPPADLNCDGVVNVFDLILLIDQWGECDDPNDCPADLNGDGVVDVLDLLILIGNWG